MRVSVTVTATKVVVDVRSMPCNTHDGHTEDSQMEQIGILAGVTPTIALLDRGYRGVKATAGAGWSSARPGDCSRA